MKCFYSLYFDFFKRFAYKVCLYKKHTRYKEDELAWEAFNHGLLDFYMLVRKNGFIIGEASVKTVLFSFYDLHGPAVNTRGSLKTPFIHRHNSLPFLHKQVQRVEERQQGQQSVQ